MTTSGDSAAMGPPVGPHPPPAGHHWRAQPWGWSAGWPAPAAGPSRTRADNASLPAVAVTLYLIGHVLLGPALKASPLLATGHALATLALGLFWLGVSRTPFKVLLVVAYISGGEVLWRGAKASVFWEYGKYAVTLLGGLALLRYYLLPRAQKLPLVYFALLLPAIAALPELDRGQISFNLSGPLALAVLTALFSTQQLDLRQFKLICLAIIGPALSMVVVATSSTLTTEGLEFVGSSNRIASGGIGPNQVSSTLSLAALMALIYLFLDRRERFLSLLIAACGLWLAAQSALTFSRGGLATTFGALAVGIVLLLRDRQSRNAVLLRAILIGLIGVYLMFPALNAFTGGALAKRFSDPSLTGRERLIKADLMAFAENPLFGAGPGQAKIYHARTFGFKSTHTEYTRLLAEHGTLGLISLILLGVMVVQRLRRRASLLSIALSMTFTTWALLFLVHAAMRLAAPSVLFALGAAWILPYGLEPNQAQPGRGRMANPWLADPRMGNPGMISPWMGRPGMAASRILGPPK